MTVEETLLACLAGAAALAGMPVKSEMVLATDSAPYVIYTQFAGSRPSVLSGDAHLGNPRFQIDVYAATKAQAIAMKAAVRAAVLACAPLNAVFISDGSAYEENTKLYRHRQDFSLWFYD